MWLIVQMSGPPVQAEEKTEEKKTEKEKKVKLIDRQREEKQENKEKILKFLQTEDKITNDDVEDMLGVSDATATRYLDELEKEGVIEQVGRSGQSVYYERLNDNPR